MIYDVADMDCVFLTYNEPKKEEFWAKIQNIVPWAVRVDGVKGSDAAHKAAAEASTTERFILIDGDNLPEERFFDLQLNIPEHMEDCVFRWRAWNAVNGLAYGNGGLSCWTKTFVQNMQTHEASDGSDETAVEFCYDPKYIAMHNVYSTTYPNGSRQQAFIAGFREGVKLNLDRGARISPQELWRRHPLNTNRLNVWMNIGGHVTNGAFCCAGARCGAFKTLLEPDWDYRDVQDFNKLNGIYNEFWRDLESGNVPDYGDALNKQIGRMSMDVTPPVSELFVQTMRTQYIEMDPMTTEQELLK